MAAADFAKRLGFYRLRAKVADRGSSTVGEHGKPVGVAVAWGENRAYQGDAVRIADPRHPGLGERMATYEDDAIAIATGDPLGYHAHRMALGIPEGGKDFSYGDAFPHEALMDMLGGVDFSKGCYVGQEVVSRMQHRGTARTRIVPVTFQGDGPPAGSEVRAAEKAVGSMGSGLSGHGLATLRLDKVADAMAAGTPLTAGSVTLTPLRPAWWTAAWPGDEPVEASATPHLGRDAHNA